ncbi:hypothetical protein L208DRAFT_1158555, partial [Tricholoma matsutake]
YHASNTDIWQHFHHSECWSCDIWILPIHQTHPSLHWVLCVISPHSRKLLLFDSFSDCLPWKHKIKEIMQLVLHLVLLANKNGQPLHIVTNEG